MTTLRQKRANRKIAFSCVHLQLLKFVVKLSSVKFADIQTETEIKTTRLELLGQKSFDTCIKRILLQEVCFNLEFN